MCVLCIDEERIAAPPATLASMMALRGSTLCTGNCLQRYVLAVVLSNMYTCVICCELILLSVLLLGTFASAVFNV